MTEYVAQPDSFEPDPQALRLYEATGLLPATDRTPEILFPDNRASEDTAFLTFLAWWHLPRPLQVVLKDRIETVLAAFSPMAGGQRLQSTLQFENDELRTTSYSRRENYDCPDELRYGIAALGRHFPGVKAISVHAVTDDYDQARQATAMHKAMLRSISELLPGDPDVDSLHHCIVPNDAREFALGIDIFNRLAMPEPELYMAMLCEYVLQSMNCMVPVTLGHELGHELSADVIAEILRLHPGSMPLPAGTDTVYPVKLFEELESFGGRNEDKNLEYFYKPEEAVAELIGTALCRRITDAVIAQTERPLSVVTSGLSEKMPLIYQWIEEALDHLYGPVPHPQSKVQFSTANSIQNVEP